MQNNQPTRAPRTYVGNGRAARNGNPVNFSVDVDQLLELIASGAAQTWTKKNGHRNVKLTMWSNGDEPDQYGNTHAVCLDTYVAPPRAEQSAGGFQTDHGNDLPF